MRLIDSLRNGTLKFMEAHDALSALIIENTNIEQDGIVLSYDGIWMSSLCDSLVRGKEDKEIVDLSDRMKTILEIKEVSPKPILVDIDSGGRPEQLANTVKRLSMINCDGVVIEDKIGEKKNSLFGTSNTQKQDTIENFVEKIKVAKKSIGNMEMIIVARIESLTLRNDKIDAIERAKAYIEAGADALLIHSSSKDICDLINVISVIKDIYDNYPIIVVPTTYNSYYDKELFDIGCNMIIYANQLMRSAIPAMSKVAAEILTFKRTFEIERDLEPISKTLRLLENEELV